MAPGRRLKTKLRSRTHLAVRGDVAPDCQRGREKSTLGIGRTFHLIQLTRRQHVGLAWRATSANVVKMKLKLLSAGIVVGVILRVII